MHILRECGHVQSYWTGIHNCIREVLEHNIRPEAKKCLLNIWEPTDLNSKDKICITLGLMVAERNIAQLWGAGVLPKVDAWKADMDWCMAREKNVYVAYMLHGGALKNGPLYGANGMPIEAISVSHPLSPHRKNLLHHKHCNSSFTMCIVHGQCLCTCI